MKAKHAVLLLACFLAVAGASVFLSRVYSDDSQAHFPSTYSTRPGGYKAAYDILQEMRLPVSRLRKSYSRLHSDRGVLVVADTVQIPISSREIRKLIQWLEKGNRLILLHGGPRYIPPPPPWVPREARQVDDPARRHSLAHKLGLAVSGHGTESRADIRTSSAGWYGVDSISVSGMSRWELPTKEWTTRVHDDLGPIILSKKAGDGEIVAISDVSIFSNRDISKNENARLLIATVLEKGRPREILFDEYHLGHGMADSFWTYAGSSAFAWILLQACLGTALFFCGKRAALSGRFRSLDSPVGRSPLEYVESMAHILESSKAGWVALEAVLHRFFAQLSRRSGIPLKRLEYEADAGRLHTRGTEEWKVVHECREAVKSNVNARTALPLARSLMALQASLMYPSSPHGGVGRGTNPEPRSTRVAPVQPHNSLRPQLGAALRDMETSRQ